MPNNRSLDPFDPCSASIKGNKKWGKGTLLFSWLFEVPTSVTHVSVGKDCAVVRFTITNNSTLASALHLPLYGIIPGYSHIEDFENSLVKTGPLSETSQTFTWTETIKLKNGKGK